MHCMLVTSLLRKHGFDFLFPTPTTTTSSSAYHQRHRSSASTATSSSPPLTPPLSDASHPSPIFPTSSTSIDWTDFRTILFSSILATDMAMHFGWIRELVELGERLAAEKERDGGGLGVSDAGGSSVASSEEELVKTDRVRICQAILKCADISNPVSRLLSLPLACNADLARFRFSFVLRLDLTKSRSTGRRCFSRNGRIKLNSSQVFNSPSQSSRMPMLLFRLRVNLGSSTSSCTLFSVLRRRSCLVSFDAPSSLPFSPSHSKLTRSSFFFLPSQNSPSTSTTASSTEPSGPIDSVNSPRIPRLLRSPSLLPLQRPPPPPLTHPPPSPSPANPTRSTDPSSP